MAAAQLAGRLPRAHFIDRVALGLPSLGDWHWRLTHRASGSGGDIVKILTHHAARRDELVDRVRLCDAVVHATKVRRPTLCKLAMKDDIVPAPTAAAIFNSIDADPARKWRFLVPYGHIDGGISNARRHALFERCLVDYFEPGKRPIELMQAWEPVLHSGDRSPAGDMPPIAGGGHEEEKPAATLFAGSVTLDSYVTLGQRDRLPYTEGFDRLAERFNERTGSSLGAHDLWRLIARLAK